MNLVEIMIKEIGADREKPTNAELAKLLRDCADRLEAGDGFMAGWSMHRMSGQLVPVIVETGPTATEAQLVFPVQVGRGAAQ